MPYLSASAVVIHYEEALYQMYAPLPLLSGSHDRSVTFPMTLSDLEGRGVRISGRSPEICLYGSS